MSALDVSQLLRPGLLSGQAVLVAGAAAEPVAGGSFAQAVVDACRRLSASVSECRLGVPGSPDTAGAAIEGEVDRVLVHGGKMRMLVVDGAGLFTSAQGSPGGAGGALSDCLQTSWEVTRALAQRAFMVADGGGRIVYVAPPADAGAHADAARAGLENLARTLSIEWARRGITAATIVPRAHAEAAAEVAALTAYLASPAGAYFSGCLLDLRGPAAAS
jgi:NAD(P)-dependent dehydrogenase (short-subunit alcohol dehydrogenase family)